MHILEILASVCTKVLFAIGSFGYDVYNQVFHRPLVVLIGSGDPNRQRSSQLIDKQMDFAAQFAAIGRIFAGFRTS